MKFNETCSSWLINQYRGSSNGKGKGVLPLLWAQALDRVVGFFFLIEGDGHPPAPPLPPGKSLLKSLQNGPRANMGFQTKGKETKTWMLGFPRVGSPAEEEVKEDPWEPRGGGSSSEPAMHDSWKARPNSVNTKGCPCPEQAGQSPSGVSLKPLLRVLNSEHTFLPSTKNIRFIHHKREALNDCGHLLCSQSYTCIIIQCVMCLSHLGGFQACYFWEANDRNPDLFTIN